MLYLANASTPEIRHAMRAGQLGQMVTPAEGRRPIPGVPYGADNGCFGKGYPGDAAWFRWLDSLPREDCLFAVAPDVVADAAATLARSLTWMPRIRALGFPVGFVAQNGLEDMEIPWDLFDVLFIGGDTAWKLSPHAARIAAEAKSRGKAVHMGRVNSARRKRVAEVFECDSVDGTYLTYGPEQNLPRLLEWMDAPSLFN